MSWARRAGAPRLIEWTGERCVPWAPDIQVVYEHFHRYLWASRVVAGRRVLDLGSGEGFGGAILSETAAEVTGVDVDERAVEHSRLNYSAPNLRFDVGSALELSSYEDNSFDAVVAFEIIEHVQDQEHVLSEVARLLDDDGILIISTPDRRAYSEISENDNPFHVRELTLEELLDMLAVAFPHVRSWGQRTITGSQLNALDLPTDDDVDPESPSFFLERAGEEWRIAGEPAPLYCIALASRSELPPTPAMSTLADCGMELLRVREREQADRVQATMERVAATQLEEQTLAITQREQQLSEELQERETDIDTRNSEIANLLDKVRVREGEIRDQGELLHSAHAELSEAVRVNRRVEESVTWNAFQTLRSRLYGALGGEGSLLARALGASLRLVGRGLVRRPAPLRQQDGTANAEEETAGGILEMPEFRRPTVSIVIPLRARADLTRACLESIRLHTSHVGYEVILIDDEADPETKSLLSEVGGARILRNEKNIGYIRSMNLAASVARGEWLVLMNNDTEATAGWLRSMLECATSAVDVGVVTPKYLYPDGSLNEAGGIIWRDATGVNYGRGDSPGLFQYEYRRETDYGSAAALMVNAELWRTVGGFDERYLPMYYEDVDLCFEARERGLRVLYEPGAVVVHVEGATAGTDAGSGHKRYQEQNRPRFQAKWRHRLDAEHLPPAQSNVRLAANRARGPHVLIVDHQVPMWDRDAGSLRMFHIMRALLELGARVTFMPDSHVPIWPYAKDLQRMGVEVMYGSLDMNAELATIGPGLTLAILSRPHAAGRWLDLIREYAPGAKIVYDTVDLHWLREARRSVAEGAGEIGAGASNGSIRQPSLPPRAHALRHLELAMIGASDATIVVSDSEREQVMRDVPDAEVLMVPTVHGIEPHVTGPEDRTGILFVGSFQHPPNVGTAVRLVKEVMPEVWRELREARVTIVGSDPPAEVRALASPLVDVVGWVEDLEPVLQGVRAMVAPLRYGAGLNGKITQCLAVGLPVVTTSLGADGLDGLDDCVLVADDASGLAAHAVRLHNDDALWREMSNAGQVLIEARCSPEVLLQRLRDLLEGAGAPAATV